MKRRSTCSATSLLTVPGASQDEERGVTSQKKQAQKQTEQEDLDTTTDEAHSTARKDWNIFVLRAETDNQSLEATSTPQQGEWGYDKDSRKHGKVVSDESHPTNNVKDKTSSSSMHLHFPDSQYTRKCKRKRVLPVYTFPNTSTMESEMKDKTEKPRSTILLVTSQTSRFRQWAHSEIRNEDTVLEIGCSSGETSGILWKKPVTRWIGLDTSAEMLQNVRHKLRSFGNLNFQSYQLDALMEPDRVRSLFPNPSVILIDIGGNRELSGVLRVLDFVSSNYANESSSMRSNLRLIILKSSNLVAELKKESSIEFNDNDGIQKGSDCGNNTDLIQIKPFRLNSLLNVDRAVTESQQRVLSRFPTHPLKAPRVLSPLNPIQAICRYHNYHPKGCIQAGCGLDHVHCHFCRTRGHRALDCPFNPTRK